MHSAGFCSVARRRRMASLRSYHAVIASSASSMRGRLVTPRVPRRDARLTHRRRASPQLTHVVSRSAGALNAPPTTAAQLAIDAVGAAEGGLQPINEVVHVRECTGDAVEARGRSPVAPAHRLCQRATSPVPFRPLPRAFRCRRRALHPSLPALPRYYSATGVARSVRLCPPRRG